MFSNICSPVYEFQTCWTIIQIHFISELQYICWKLLFEIIIAWKKSLNIVLKKPKSSEKLLTIFNSLCLHAWKTMELWKIQGYDLAWHPRWLLRMTSLWEQRLDTIPTILLSFGTGRGITTVRLFLLQREEWRRNRSWFFFAWRN